MTAIGFGTEREVWFATLSNPNTKFSFIIRDDAFAKSGVAFGRTTRIDKPINLGPGSGWQQLSWEGGKGQLEWKDEQMYEEGDIDPYSRTGKMRMWPGWSAIKKDATRKFDGYTLARGGQSAIFGESKLYFAERNQWYTGATPSGGHKAYVYNPTAKTVSALQSTNFPNTLGSNGFTAICAATDDASANEYVYFGTLGGLWVYAVSGSGTWFKDTNAPTTNTVQWDSMVSFRDALYYCSDKALYKRTPTAPLGTLGTHTKIKLHNAAYRCMGLAVWQNRLWYGIQYSGNRVSIGTSDGVTAAEAIQMPEEFVITGLHAHYGALYIFGGKPQAVPGTKAVPANIGQVWKYTGSSLTLLWESNDTMNSAAVDGKAHVVGPGTSFGSCLVWGHQAYEGTVEERAGLMMYDAEKDSLFDGPKLPMHPNAKAQGMVITGIVGWDNTIAVAYHDNKDYSGNYPGVDWPSGVAYLRMPDYYRDDMNAFDKHTFKGASVEYTRNKKVQWMKSSTYRGDDSSANEAKVWLSGRMNVRVPSEKCEIEVFLLKNEGYWRPPNYGGQNATVKSDGSAANYRTLASGRHEPLATAVKVATITSNGSDDWRVVQFPLKDENGVYISSQKMQYAVVISNTGGVDFGETAEVDSMEVQWMLAPKKRLQYRVRAVLQDAQVTLSGAANSLTTAQAQADELQTLWSGHQPFLMWGPFADSHVAADLHQIDAIEVFPTEDGYNVTQYRVESDDDQVAQEVALTLIENVTV